MATPRGFERLINFSDAVVAIALTLLILPLVEIPGELGADDSLTDLLREHAGALGSFLLSFVVIWRLWRTHHQRIEYFRAYNRTVANLTFVWLLTIVLLPFPTELLNTPANARGGAIFYIAVLFVSALSLELLAVVGKRHPELLRAEDPDVIAWLANKPGVADLTTSFLVLLALVATSIFPSITTWPLLLLLLDGTLVKLLTKKAASANPGG